MYGWIVRMPLKCMCGCLFLLKTKLFRLDPDFFGYYSINQVLL